MLLPFRNEPVVWRSLFHYEHQGLRRLLAWLQEEIDNNPHVDGILLEAHTTVLIKYHIIDRQNRTPAAKREIICRRVSFCHNSGLIVVLYNVRCQLL
jgi:hypothetical protein